MNLLFNKHSLLLLLLLWCLSGEAASTVVRTITGTNTASPMVVITATPDASVSAYAVQENLPAGLTPANITQGGVWDAANQAVKWGPFDTNLTALTLSYTVTGSPGTYTVSGVGSFDGVSVPTTGANQIVIPPSAPSSVVRTIASGTNVSLVATPAATVSSYAVQENLPAGLTPTNITAGGVWDAVNLAVKWGPWDTNAPQTLSYTVTGSPGTYTVSGVGSFDGVSVPTMGATQIVISAGSTVFRTITNGTDVTLVATPAPGVGSYAVEDDLPGGLTPNTNTITQGGTWDAANRAVKWGPWFDTLARTLSYTVTGSAGTYTVSGVGSFDGVPVPTTGDSQIVIPGPVPSRPIFTNQPVSEVVSLGQSVMFTAEATGNPPPSYQWQINGVNINGATGASYSIPSAGLGNIGLYDVVAANSAGSSTSSVVTLGFLDLKLLAAVYLTGPIGRTYEIEAASALAPTNWITVTTVQITNQPFIWVDYSSATNAQQFYRAVPQ